MDVVLALSITPDTVRWLLVEGSTGGGAPVGQGSFEIEVEGDEPEFADDFFDVDALLDSLLTGDGPAAAHRLHAIGVTWAFGAEVEASVTLGALARRGLDDVVVVSAVEAVEALACGIATVGGYDDVVVCVVEPDVAVVAVAGEAGVVAECMAPPRGTAAVIADILAFAERRGTRPDAVFVLGSTPLTAIVATLAESSEAPVISATEAEFALARGVALAAAAGIASLVGAARDPVPPHRPRVVLTTVVAAAAVTFVVSLSLVLGQQWAPGSEPARAPVAEAVATAPEATITAPVRVAAGQPTRPVPVVEPVGSGTVRGPGGERIGGPWARLP